VHLAGDVALETANDLPLGLAFLGPPADIGHTASDSEGQTGPGRLPSRILYLRQPGTVTLAVLATEGVGPSGTSPAKTSGYGPSAVTSAEGCMVGRSKVETSS
jgi:hypothetical protein